ncbi:hypothetical protein GGD38_002127 [Chitinophagaceae bacterium OAS944]|nr:hypothetical protein [Chitinophagaceae bacterium OAS944]
MTCAQEHIQVPVRTRLKAPITDQVNSAVIPRRAETLNLISEAEKGNGI